MKDRRAAILLLVAIALASCVAPPPLTPAKEITIYVTGEVNTAGKYVLPVGSRVSNAIAKAGGVDRVGSRDRIVLARRDASGELNKYSVDLTGKGPRLSEDMLLVDGDSIFVPPSFG